MSFKEGKPNPSCFRQFTQKCIKSFQVSKFFPIVYHFAQTLLNTSELTFTRIKSTMKTQVQQVKPIQSYQYRH